ncbi:hypothetical protein M422DRAFT_243637 [Sphaerobolus stellatus SS14]|nr:hypothetical protein M422DRAFT_243637 [Sphaerobolus stellatus SS14]
MNWDDELWGNEPTTIDGMELRWMPAASVLDCQDVLVATDPLLQPQADTETSRFRMDWHRCVAPLTLLQIPDRHWGQDARPVEADPPSPFLNYYAPWLPAISLFVTATTIPLTISPFLSTVIHAIASSEIPHAFHIHFAALEIEYHYLTLIYVTRFLPTVCYVIPITQASDETKALIWSWSVMGNKAAHRVLELWNKFAAAVVEDKAQAHPLVIPPLAPHLPPCLHPRHSPHVHIPKNLSPSILPNTAPLPRPNRIYSMIFVAVMLILRHQVTAYEFGRHRSIFESLPARFTRQADIAIPRIVKNMGPFSIVRTSGGGGDHRDDGYAESRDGGRRGEHAAVRYAEIIDTLLHVWEEKHSAKVYALSSNDDSSQPGLFEHKDELDCAASCGAVERNTPTPATQRFDKPYPMDSALLSGCDTTHQHQQPSHYAPQDPHAQSHPSLPSPHQPHAQAQSQHSHYAPPPNPPPTHNIKMDLSLLNTNLFSDAATTFT